MRQVIPIQRVCVGRCTHDITVRRIGSGWNCRVLTNGQVNQEMRVDARADIGAACREMLRWEDKVGNLSAFAAAARSRGVRR
jgi:MOSC domain-containing protein YiiM